MISQGRFVETVERYVAKAIELDRYIREGASPEARQKHEMERLIRSEEFRMKMGMLYGMAFSEGQQSGRELILAEQEDDRKKRARARARKKKRAS